MPAYRHAGCLLLLSNNVLHHSDGEGPAAEEAALDGVRQAGEGGGGQGGCVKRGRVAVVVGGKGAVWVFLDADAGVVMCHLIH